MVQGWNCDLEGIIPGQLGMSAKISEAVTWSSLMPEDLGLKSQMSEALSWRKGKKPSWGANMLLPHGTP